METGCLTGVGGLCDVGLVYGGVSLWLSLSFVLTFLFAVNVVVWSGRVGGCSISAIACQAELQALSLDWVQSQGCRLGVERLPVLTSSSYSGIVPTLICGPTSKCCRAQVLKGDKLRTEIWILDISLLKTKAMKVCRQEF